MEQTQEEKDQEKSLIERTEKAFNSRMEDIRILRELLNLENENDYEAIKDKIRDEYGEPGEYGLCLDYVEEGTFKDQREPYIRFQLSYGGPSEEFRIYANDEAEFWFLDWFCGEHKNLNSSEYEELLNFLGASDYEELKQLVKPE